MIHKGPEVERVWRVSLPSGTAASHPVALVQELEAPKIPGVYDRSNTVVYRYFCKRNQGHFEVDIFSQTLPNVSSEAPLLTVCGIGYPASVKNSTNCCKTSIIPQRVNIPSLLFQALDNRCLSAWTPGRSAAYDSRS